MEDLIKREDAIDEIRKESQELHNMNVIPLATVGAMVDAIVRVPSAEKQGEWLFKEITDDYHITGQCSICKERRRIDNFCPNCGARMKGADDA